MLVRKFSGLFWKDLLYNVLPTRALMWKGNFIDLFWENVLCSPPPALDWVLQKLQARKHKCNPQSKTMITIRRERVSFTFHAHILSDDISNQTSDLWGHKWPTDRGNTGPFNRAPAWDKRSLLSLLCEGICAINEAVRDLKSFIESDWNIYTPIISQTCISPKHHWPNGSRTPKG